jgi:hypothetical protein
MTRIISRLLLGLLVVLQAVSPAFACNCEVIDNFCGCATECASCEPVVVESQPCDACSATVESSSCGCQAETSESTTEPDATREETPKPQAAETKKPKTFATPVEEKPTEVPPAPALETPTTNLPAAPINVPSEPATTPSTTEGIFPGPAPVESIQPQVPAAETPTDSGSLFDEPAPVATPTDTTAPAVTTPAVEDTTEESTVTEDLFVEPSQPASEPNSSEPAPTEEVPEIGTETETETLESESTEEPATESDPLDDLFGPSTPSTEPEPETKPEDEDTEKAADPFDPFSQQELPRELRAPGGLASSEFRNWSNRAASFSCDARLVRLTTDGVFLNQPSGEVVAMSFSQLSDADLSFVRAQVRAQRTMLARTAASVQLAVGTAQ